ncbi:hypothetical protein AYO40_03180 [Planctomycetaceae bacterium SCGC AG-212-D15]|nr:hypothetical protein AYO40_03180 [Planctomycetaceae bacterium SCGC AG-212-D15]
MRARILLLFCLLCVGCGAKSGPVVMVGSQALFAAYGKDIVAADQKYTGNAVEISDVVGKVEKDDAGRYYLVAAEKARLVKGKDEQAMEVALNAKYLPGVMLYIDLKGRGQIRRPRWQGGHCPRHLQGDDEGRQDHTRLLRRGRGLRACREAG